MIIDLYNWFTYFNSMFRVILCQLQARLGLVWFGLVSAIVGYLMPNTVYT